MKKGSKGLITALVLLLAALIVAYKRVEGFQKSGYPEYDLLGYWDNGPDSYLIIYQNDANIISILYPRERQDSTINYQIKYATGLLRYSTDPNADSSIPLKLDKQVSDFWIRGTGTYKDNRYLSTIQVNGSVPNIWFLPESTTNYKFSQQLNLSNGTYSATINGNNYIITLYDLNGQLIQSNLPTAIPPGIGHLKVVEGNTEIRNSVQMADGTWQYVKLKIEPYVAPPSVSTTGQTGAGVSAQAGSSSDTGITLNQNTILMGCLGFIVIILLLRK